MRDWLKIPLALDSKFYMSHCFKRIQRKRDFSHLELSCFVKPSHRVGKPCTCKRPQTTAALRGTPTEEKFTATLLSDTWSLLHHLPWNFLCLLPFWLMTLELCSIWEGSGSRYIHLSANLSTRTSNKARCVLLPLESHPFPWSALPPLKLTMFMWQTTL